MAGWKSAAAARLTRLRTRDYPSLDYSPLFQRAFQVRHCSRPFYAVAVRAEELEIRELVRPAFGAEFYVVDREQPFGERLSASGANAVLMLVQLGAPVLVSNWFRAPRLSEFALRRPGEMSRRARCTPADSWRCIRAGDALSPTSPPCPRRRSQSTGGRGARRRRRRWRSPRTGRERCRRGLEDALTMRSRSLSGFWVG